MLQARVARDLDHAALRCEVALEDHESTRRPQRLFDGDDDVLSRCLLGVLDLLGDGAACGRELGPVYEAGVEQALAEQTAPASAVDVDGRVAAPRLEVGDDRGAATHGIEVVDVEGDPDLAGYREQVQYEVGRASGRRAGGDTVLERLAGQEALRCEAALQQLHD
jgi:hypothetical protein